MMDTASPRSGRARTVLLPALILLGLSGIALRIPILAVPPLLPLIRDEFRMSETQIGALMSMPLALFALAAVPGSLLVARLGARTTLLGGLLIAAFASGARGFAMGPFTLYLASILMGLGVSVMQPALPRLVRSSMTLGSSATAWSMAARASSGWRSASRVLASICFTAP